MGGGHGDSSADLDKGARARAALGITQGEVTSEDDAVDSALLGTLRSLYDAALAEYIKAADEACRKTRLSRGGTCGLGCEGSVCGGLYDSLLAASAALGLED
jgi:hypothetical protein